MFGFPGGKNLIFSFNIFVRAAFPEFGIVWINFFKYFQARKFQFSVIKDIRGLRIVKFELTIISIDFLGTFIENICCLCLFKLYKSYFLVEHAYTYSYAYKF